MMKPQRAAVLALSLLALAASASAQCTASYFQMDLVSAASSTDELAKCLSSVKVSLNSGCNVTITSLAAGGSFVDAIWSSDSAATYKRYQECPTNGAVTVPSATDGPGVAAAIETALEKHIYGGKKDTAIASIAYAAGGKVTITRSGAYIYAITYVEDAFNATNIGEDAADIVVADGTGLTLDTHYIAEDLSATCGAGKYGIVLADTIKVCPLCPAGTSGDGFGCTSCEAGQKSDVGAATCSDCLTGTYANGGNSDCLPCPTGTYSNTNKTSECTACPSDSHSWIPGSTACYRCSAGVPRCVVGTDPDSATACANTGTSSPGSAVVSVAQMGSCALANDYAFPMYSKCSSWAGVNPSLKLSLAVAGDCSITISPMTDKSCAEVGANTTGAGYDYSSLRVRAYYKGTKTLTTLLPSVASGSSSFMLSIINNGTALNMNAWAATSEPAKSTAVGAVTCTSGLTNAGGSIASSTMVACSAGSYNVSGQNCVACQPGYHCTGTTAPRRACTAGTANPYLGGTNATYCGSCNSSDANPFTSLAGADYCTVPWSNVTCTVNGTEWDASANKCIQCRAGTFRVAGDSNLECQECPAGYYSGVGASVCVACPIGQYAPSTGLADQTLFNSTLNCLACPRGSLALSGSQTATNGTTLAIAATFCDSCPAGSYANVSNAAQACVMCPQHTYRNGDASPENNECKVTPAGYKLDLNVGATEISQCPNGTFSFVQNVTVGASTRIPAADATVCLTCADATYGGPNLYAPRPGMSKCLACKGGAIPSNATALGPDFCTGCDAGTFRNFYTAAATCSVCPAGSETGPSNRQSCITCRVGQFKPANGTVGIPSVRDFCQECPKNTYMDVLGATACNNCSKGYETQDTGNAECTPCSVGFFNPVDDAQDCRPAPAGSYVDAAGAFFTTPCSIGTFNNETGQDSCLPCAPGQYANTLGSKACKTCPSGTFSGGQASTCRACSAGYFALAGSSECSPCRPGFYTNVTRSSTCSLCPMGSQCPSIAVSTPQLCRRGYFANKDGQRTCTPCPVNTFVNTLGNTQCTPCAAGTNTRGLTGQTRCQAARINTLRRSMA